jgi:hypothetical protein
LGKKNITENLKNEEYIAFNQYFQDQQLSPPNNLSFGYFYRLQNTKLKITYYSLEYSRKSTNRESHNVEFSWKSSIKLLFFC